MGKVCGITGHRLHSMGLPYKDESNPALQALKQEIEAKLDHLIEQEGYTRIIAGLAVGVDIWVCEMTLERMKTNPSLELEVAIPFEDQIEKWDKPYLAAYKPRYEAIRSSGRIIKNYKPDADFQENKNQSYHNRNQYIVDSSDAILAVWNGINRSGTGSTVSKAKKANKTCIIINPRKFRSLVDTEK